MCLSGLSHPSIKAGYVRSTNSTLAMPKRNFATYEEII